MAASNHRVPAIIDLAALERAMSGSKDTARTAVSMAFFRLYDAMHQLADEDLDAVWALMLSLNFWQRTDELVLGGTKAPRGTRDNVRHWWLTWIGTAGRSAVANRSAKRELMMDWCRALADKAKRGDAAYGVDRATDNAIQNFQSLLLPEEFEAVKRQRARVRALVAAMASNVGGRGKRASKSVDEATESLFGALGWGGSAEAIRKARTRLTSRARAAKNRPAKKGH